jgi:hypothetical protein
LLYSGCQKNVPIAERFFATTLMPPSFFRNINMTSGIIIDEALWTQTAFQFHPLVNTSTLVVSSDNLKRFLAVTGHDVRTLAVPSQK